MIWVLRRWTVTTQAPVHHIVKLHRRRRAVFDVQQTRLQLVARLRTLASANLIVTGPAANSGATVDRLSGYLLI